MAKTIEEMALERFPESNRRDSEGFYSDANFDIRYGYTVGANVVLEELDKICYDYNKTYEERYLSIADKIKELKGE